MIFLNKYSNQQIQIKKQVIFLTIKYLLIFLINLF